MKPRAWIPVLLIATGVFAVNVALTTPLFLPGEMPYRGSIEAGYVSMARFIAAHPNPWGWNPTQYCGLPTQFTYLPVLPYLTGALIRLLPGADPGHLYRVVVAMFACLGPVTLFLFALYFTRSRLWALAGALGYTFLSPSYGLIEQIDTDRGFVTLPWRLHVLAKYGEGPHTAGLALLPLALAALWAAVTGGKYWQVLLAAVALAAVTLTNWVAALALAFCCAMLLLAGLWGGPGGPPHKPFQIRRAVLTAGLAYLLACFWLTPRFLKTVAFNWPADAFNYHLRGQQTLLFVGLIAGLLLIRVIFLKFHGEVYLCFLALMSFGFAYIVLIYYKYGLDTIPESRRYALEFELLLFPLMVECLHLSMRTKSSLVHWAFLAFAGLLLWTTGASHPWRFVTKNNDLWKPIPREQTVEYRLAKWIADKHPVGRVFAFGGVAFRLNSWFDIPQVGGTFESGLRNRMPVHFSYQIRLGIGSPAALDAQNAVMQLKALRAEYVVVNGPGSKEYYHDFKHPWKFDGLLERVYRQDDDAIYRLPVESMAHLVRPSELPPEPPIAERTVLLQPYVAAMQDPSRPKLRTAWRGPAEIEIEGRVPEGMLAAVQVTHDWGWTGSQDGQPIAITPDRIGFMVVHARASPESRILLKYQGTTDQRVMAAISALTWIGAVAALFVARRPRPSGRLR